MRIKVNEHTWGNSAKENFNTSLLFVCCEIIMKIFIRYFLFYLSKQSILFITDDANYFNLSRAFCFITDDANYFNLSRAFCFITDDANYFNLSRAFCL